MHGVTTVWAPGSWAGISLAYPLSKKCSFKWMGTSPTSWLRCLNWKCPPTGGITSPGLEMGRSPLSGKYVTKCFGNSSSRCYISPDQYNTLTWCYKPQKCHMIIDGNPSNCLFLYISLWTLDDVNFKKWEDARNEDPSSEHHACPHLLMENHPNVVEMFTWDWRVRLTANIITRSSNCLSVYSVQCYSAFISTVPLIT